MPRGALRYASAEAFNSFQSKPVEKLYPDRGMGRHPILGMPSASVATTMKIEAPAGCGVEY